MGKLNDLGSDAETTLHLWAAKIEITILKAGFLQSIGFIGDYERRVLGFVDHFKLFDDDFDITGRKLWVWNFFLGDGSSDRNDIFVSDVRDFDPFFDHELNDASVVA
jgi:hypothetical protein